MRNIRPLPCIQYPNVTNEEVNFVSLVLRRAIGVRLFQVQEPLALIFEPGRRCNFVIQSYVVLQIATILGKCMIV